MSIFLPAHRHRFFPLAVAVLLAPSHVAPAAEGVEEGLPDHVALFRDLPYREGDNPSWKLDLAKPRAPADAPRPAIVVIHGGGWIEGDKSSFSTPARRVPGNVIDFAERGFVAVTINYRLAGDAPYPAAIDDCRCAVRWLRAHAAEYDVDPARIGAWGNSAGGHLALLLGMPAEELPPADLPWPHESSLVQAAASDSGPVDLLAQHRQGTLRAVVEKLMGGPPEGDRAGDYERASPLHRISPRCCPLLLIYGVADGQVPVESADRFVLALEQAGLRDVTYLRLAGVDHCPHSLAEVPWLPPVVDDFFARALRGVPAPP